MSFARLRRRHQPPGRSRIDSNICRKHLSVLVFERCYAVLVLLGELRLNRAWRDSARDHIGNPGATQWRPIFVRRSRSRRATVFCESGDLAARFKAEKSIGPSYGAAITSGSRSNDAIWFAAT
jgi:hypothetical protein